MRNEKIKRFDGTDDGQWQSIMDGIRLGMPEKVIAEGVGMSVRSFEAWVSQGRSEFEDGEDTVMARFYRDTRVAYADFVREQLTNAPQAKSSHWFEWLLAKRSPKEFGDKDEHASEEKVTIVLENDAVEIPTVKVPNGVEVK